MQGNALGLAILLIAAGVVVFLAVRFILLAAPRLRGGSAQDAKTPPLNTLQPHEDGLILIQAGGRVISINTRAREMFRLGEHEEADLERLARHVRPGEAFLSICSAEGAARFFLEGRMLSATSYRVCDEPLPVTAVALRFDAEGVNLEDTTHKPAAQNLQLFNELSVAMAGSLDLEATLKAIHQSVEKFIAADFFEIGLWNSESETLAAFRILGQPGTERPLEAQREPIRIHQGLAGVVARDRKSLLIKELEKNGDIQSGLDRTTAGLGSFVGVPLMVGNNFIGTLGVGSVNQNAFEQDDQALLMLLSGQAALAVHNAMRYRKEQLRTAELLGLAQLTQAIGVVRDPRSMFTRLVESVAPLVDVDILGFLIYNENNRTLEGQEPFLGLPKEFLAVYRVPVPANSPAEQALLNQDLIIAENASESSEWERLGLKFAAEAASLRDTALIPLNSSGRMLGYLQASNHRSGNPVFSQDELHLLRIICNQAAPIIENATLVRQARQRAQRAEALRRISALVTSSARFEEILKYALQELARLLNADAAGIFLVDEKKGALRLHRKSVYGKLAEKFSGEVELSAEDAQYHFTVTGSNHALVVGNLEKGAAIIPYYQQIARGWGINSIVAVPLVVRDEAIGEIWLGDDERDAFDQADVQVVATAAGQLAGVVEQNSLSAQTDESLRQQVNQLTALTRISRELSTSLDLNYLVQLVYDEALRTTQADCGTILLFDLNRPAEEEPTIHLHVGDVPPERLTELEISVLKRGSPEIIADTTAMSETLPHEQIASMLIVPVIYQQRPSGLMLLHSKRLHHFEGSAIEIAQSLASQAAVALGNAYQYEAQSQRSSMLKRQLDTLGKLLQLLKSLRSDMRVEVVLESLAQAIRETTPFQVVLISLIEGDTRMLKRVHGLGMSTEAWGELSSRSQPWENLLPMFKPEFQFGSVYFIPADRKPIIPEGVHSLAVLPAVDDILGDQWHADDFLLMPLFDSQQNPMGLISLDAPADGRRPDRVTLEALELFAVQASALVEQHSRVSLLENQLGEAQTARDVLEKKWQSVNLELPGLVLKEKEQSAALERLKTQAAQVRAGLEMAEIANQQADLDSLLRTLADEMLTRFQLQAVVVAEASSSGPRLVATAGNLPDGVNPEALLGQRNPLRQMLQDGQMVLTANLEHEQKWAKSPLLASLGAQSFLALPIELGKGRRAGVLALDGKPMTPFDEDDWQIFSQLARQVSISAQNLQLMHETQDRLREVNLLLEFSRNLGIQDPTRILQALVETTMKVLPEAHTCWVGLWEEKTSSLAPQSALGFVDSTSLMQIRFEFVGKTPSLPARVFQSTTPQRGDVHFGQDYNLSAQDLMLYRKATGGKLPVSSLVVPLIGASDCLGVMVLDNINTSTAFNENDEALALSLAQQAALGLQNARLYAETHRLTQELEARVEERTLELRREHNNTQTLLKIITELSASLEINLVLSRALTVLNSSVGAEQSMILLTQSPTVYQAGEDLMDEQLEGQTSLEKTLAKWVVRRKQMLVVDDILVDERWKVDETNPPRYHSVFAVPLVLGEEALGALMLFHRQPGVFIAELATVVEATARQMAIALNNAELFTLIRDQAENLGGMLREQQMEASRSRAILESVADGVLVTDAENRITLFNDSAEHILNLSAAAMLEKPLDEVSGIFGKASKVWMQTIHQWSENPEAYTPGESYAERLELENGKVVAINLAAVIYRGTFLATVTIFRDITHEVQVDRLKSEFVANVSHELRTPMTSIKGYVEIMLMGAAGELSPQQTHFLGIVKSNTERLNGLVNDLLDVSRIEAGRVVLNFKPIDLKQIAEEVIGEFQRRSREDKKAMIFLLEAPANLVEVEGDALRIRQVLSNLVSNGYNYTPANGKVTVRLNRADNEVQVDVVDTGVGISQKTQKRIFERFFRGEDPLVLASAGTGLGLAISKIMIEMHHGRIWFTSRGEPGKGSVFSFSIPVKQPEG